MNKEAKIKELEEKRIEALDDFDIMYAAKLSAKIDDLKKGITKENEDLELPIECTGAIELDPTKKYIFQFEIGDLSTTEAIKRVRSFRELLTDMGIDGIINAVRHGKVGNIEVEEQNEPKFNNDEIDLLKHLLEKCIGKSENFISETKSNTKANDIDGCQYIASLESQLVFKKSLLQKLKEEQK